MKRAIWLFIAGSIVAVLFFTKQNDTYQQSLDQKAAIVTNMGGYPETLAEAIALTKALGDRVAVTDWYATPWTGNERRELETYSRVYMGYYLTMRMNTSCGGKYENVAFQMHEKKNGKWETTRSVNLEGIDFNDSSGSKAYAVEGFTVVLDYSSGYKCAYDTTSVYIQ